MSVARRSLSESRRGVAFALPLAARATRYVESRPIESPSSSSCCSWAARAASRACVAGSLAPTVTAISGGAYMLSMSSGCTPFDCTIAAAMLGAGRVSGVWMGAAASGVKENGSSSPSSTSSAAHAGSAYRPAPLVAPPPALASSSSSSPYIMSRSSSRSVGGTGGRSGSTSAGRNFSTCVSESGTPSMSVVPKGMATPSRFDSVSSSTAIGRPSSGDAATDTRSSIVGKVEGVDGGGTHDADRSSTSRAMLASSGRVMNTSSPTHSAQ
mmetsp:Transcript_10246/g.32509  ORF Transcript_10246/g.32509 Transcript_10246/m.32509 type:complete len:269 (+) Transcript_10246:978-1784(+)